MSLVSVEFMPQEFAGNVYSSSLSKEHYLKYEQSVPRIFEVAVEVFDELAHRSAIGISTSPKWMRRVSISRFHGYGTNFGARHSRRSYRILIP